MAVEIPLESNEELIFHKGFIGERHTIPFEFAVSKNAIFVSKEKHFAKESWYFERIPLTQIQQVFLSKEPPLFLWATAFIVFSFGLLLSVLMIATFLNNEPGIKSIWILPILITIFGCALPFLAKDRKTLVIQMNGGKYKWKPKMQFDKKKREQIKELQEAILSICEKIGINVFREQI